MLTFHLDLSTMHAVCDTIWYGLAFKGMKLGGLILIGLGFLLVLLPDDWPDYVTLLIR